MILEINDLTKSFGAVEVLKGVSMSVDSAQCYGLVGDNGAGKSTMLKVLSGVHRPDSGEIRLEDRVMDFNAEIGARLAGIEMIFQDLALCDDLDATANIFLGREQRKPTVGRFGFLDHQGMRKQTEEVLASLGAPAERANTNTSAPAVPMTASGRRIGRTHADSRCHSEGGRHQVVRGHASRLRVTLFLGPQHPTE